VGLALKARPIGWIEIRIHTLSWHERLEIDLSIMRGRTYASTITQAFGSHALTQSVSPPIWNSEVLQMGTTSALNSAALNPGVANLLQTLTNVNSPIVSSPTLVSALEKAPPSDIVQLSAAATQLQNVSSLFGNSNAGNPFTPGTNNNDFTNLESVLSGSSGPTSASAQAAAQLQNVDALFGIQSTATPTNGSNPVSNLESLLAGPTPSGVSPSNPATQAAQLAQYESLQQIQNTQNLFGTGSSGSTSVFG
jgi:hypothetical protein